MGEGCLGLRRASAAAKCVVWGLKLLPRLSESVCTCLPVEPQIARLAVRQCLTRLRLKRIRQTKKVQGTTAAKAGATVAALASPGTATSPSRSQHPKGFSMV